MKRIVKKILVTCFAIILAAGCVSAVSQAKVNGYYFKYKGVSVTMHTAAKKLIAKSGKAQKTKVKKSCAYKGKDRTYQYKDYILYTYSNSANGPEFVMGITFRTSKVKTAEGIKIGSAESAVTQKYGKAKAKFGIYNYIKGNTKLQFEVTDGKVTNIRYIANKVK